MNIQDIFTMIDKINVEDILQSVYYQTDNKTEVNHLIPTSYYANWAKYNEVLNKDKIPRDQHVKLSNKSGTIKLQNFMFRKFIITQELESSFTNYKFGDIYYDTEKIQLISKLGVLLLNKNIKNFYFYNREGYPSKITWGIVHNPSNKKKKTKQEKKLFNTYEKQHVENLFMQFHGKNTECRLFLDLFKARLSLWEFSDEISTNTTKNIIGKMLLIFKNSEDGVFLYKKTIKIILCDILNQQIITKLKNGLINNVEFLQIAKDIWSNIDIISDIELKQNQNKIINLLERISDALNDVNIENSLLCTIINSYFFKDFLNVIRVIDEKKPYLILSSEQMLTTGESPLVYFTINQAETKEFIKNFVDRSLIDAEYLKYSKETGVYYIPYSEKILIVHAEYWFLDYLHSLIQNNKQHEIIKHYEKIKKDHNDNNNYGILKNIMEMK